MTKPFESFTLPQGSPWGRIDHATELAPGIWGVETASHGGLCLSSSRLAAMPETMRETNCSPGRWFEEDCDWALVCAIFPDAFPDAAHKHAVSSLQFLSQH